MVTTTITYPATSVGTGTAETTLNAGNNVIVPDSTREVISFSPFFVPTAEIDADEQHVVRIRWNSDDVNITPKDLVWNYYGTIDALANSMMHPIFQNWELHIPTNGTENITITGTQLAATTVADQIGIQTFHTTGRTGKAQQYWINPGVETAIGTAAATVTGSTYTFNNVRALNWVSGYAVIATAAIDDSVGGTMTLTSPDYQSALPVSFPTMPGIAGTSAVGGVGGPMQAKWPVDIPTRQNVSITESFANAQAVAGNGTFMSMVGFLR